MLENSLFGKLLITFLISAVPIIELRGAIPFAVAHGLPLQMAYAVAVLGNLLPVPFIMLFARKVFEIIRAHAKRLDAWVSKMEDRAIRKSAVVKKFSTFGLFLLVAIPLPGTGAWTGALVAAMLNMRIRRAFPAIALGVLAAGAIMLLASLGVDSLIS